MAGMSATAEKGEVQRAEEHLGMPQFEVLAQNPIQSQFKFVKLDRPSDNYTWEGKTTKNGIYHPGQLDQLSVGTPV